MFVDSRQEIIEIMIAGAIQNSNAEFLGMGCYMSRCHSNIATRRFWQN